MSTRLTKCWQVWVRSINSTSHPKLWSLIRLAPLARLQHYLPTITTNKRRKFSFCSILFLFFYLLLLWCFCVHAEALTAYEQWNQTYFLNRVHIRIPSLGSTSSLFNSLTILQKSKFAKFIWDWNAKLLNNYLQRTTSFNTTQRNWLLICTQHWCKSLFPSLIFLSAWRLHNTAKNFVKL